MILGNVGVSGKKALGGTGCPAASMWMCCLNPEKYMHWCFKTESDNGLTEEPAATDWLYACDRTPIQPYSYLSIIGC